MVLFLLREVTERAVLMEVLYFHVREEIVDVGWLHGAPANMILGCGVGYACSRV